MDKKLSDIDIILIGELHGWKRSIKLERDILEKTNVSFFLHELLENFKITSSEAAQILRRKEWKSKILSFNMIKPILQLIRDLGVVGIGCDLRNHGINNIEAYHVKGRDLTREEEGEEEILMQRREEQHMKVIRRYLKQKKRPIVAIVGTYHLREGTPLMQALRQENKLKTLLIYPELQGELFYGQEQVKIKDLVYGQKELNPVDR